MKAANVPPAGSDLGAVEHVVYLMLENRSFDHYFGSYPGVRGFDDHATGTAGVFAQAWPGAPATASPSATLLPFHLDTATMNAECTFDLSHNWDAQHYCWNEGRMDKWVSTHSSAAFEGADGVLTMGYYTRQDLDFYYALADAFTLCDAYHCSVMGPTHPNRLHAVSGTIGPDGRQGGPVLITNSNAQAQFSVSWSTIPERLQAAGVSWKTYNPKGTAYQPTSGVAMAVSDNILLYFSQYQDPSSELYKRAFGPIYPDDFVRDVTTDALPEVSWVMPGIGQDEHPPSPPGVGMAYAHQLLATLVSNPKVWAKTVLFVMYDENDGFFDHVAPPIPPPSPAASPSPSTRCRPMPRASMGQWVWGSVSPCSSYRRSAEAATSARTPSTTRPKCASLRRASVCTLPTSPRGAAVSPATSHRRFT